jgi:hypothetical protein
MFRTKTVCTVFLISVGTIAGFSVSASASDDGPAIPPLPDQPPAKQPAASQPAGPKPATNSPAKAVKPSTSSAQPDARGGVIAPLATDSAADEPAPPQRGPAAFPALRQFMQPDGSFLLPGGVGTINPGSDNIGIQINTPQGQFQINVPRRERVRQNAEDAAGPTGDSPDRPGLDAVRTSREFSFASRAFATRNYSAVLRRVDRFLERDPGDRDLLQLRSLANFALADYTAAYRDALAATANGDVWDWPTLFSLYGSADEYTAQYRALAEHISANPRSSKSMFLYAYHNQMLGHREAARRDFARVAALDPANETAKRLAAGEGPPRPRQSPTSSGDFSPGTPATGAPPQGKPRSGPSVDLGQPESLGAPAKPETNGAK